MRLLTGAQLAIAASLLASEREWLEADNPPPARRARMEEYAAIKAAIAERERVEQERAQAAIAAAAERRARRYAKKAAIVARNQRR